MLLYSILRDPNIGSVRAIGLLDSPMSKGGVRSVQPVSTLQRHRHNGDHPQIPENNKGASRQRQIRLQAGSLAPFFSVCQPWALRTSLTPGGLIVQPCGTGVSVRKM